MEFQSNQLIYQKEYTKRQQIIYLLIHHLHDREGWGYRKISKWLNKGRIKTHTGKNWFSSSVISVLKRKHERDLMNKCPYCSEEVHIDAFKCKHCGANLSALTFMGDDAADLSLANLSGANLNGVSFTGADLSGSSIKNTDLNRGILCNTKTPWGIDYSGC